MFKFLKQVNLQNPYDLFQRPTKCHISTSDRMTHFDGEPKVIFHARPNDIFRRPTKWHITTHDQMTYFDARPNDIFRRPTKWKRFQLQSCSNDTSWRQTKWHISTPDQIANIHSRPNDIFRCPTKWLVFKSSSNDIFRRPTKWHISTIYFLFSWWWMKHDSNIKLWSTASFWHKSHTIFNHQNYITHNLTQINIWPLNLELWTPPLVMANHCVRTKSSFKTKILWTRPIKWDILTANQMIYFNAQPKITVGSVQKDIFLEPDKITIFWCLTKWYIFKKPNQLTYLVLPTKGNISTTDLMIYFYSQTHFQSRLPTKWDISTPEQMIYFHAQSNDIYSVSDQMVLRIIPFFLFMETL